MADIPLDKTDGEVVDVQKLMKSFDRLAICSVGLSWIEQFPKHLAVLYARNACLALAVYFKLPWVDEKVLGIVTAVNKAVALYYTIDGIRREEPLPGAIRSIKIL